MDEQVVGEPVLNAQRKPIESGIPVIALLCVHIVYGEQNFFSQQFVVIREQRSIEMQEFVVPQNVEDPRLRCGTVADQLQVVAQNPYGLLPQTDMRILIAPEL